MGINNAQSQKTKTKLPILLGSSLQE